MTQVAQKRPKSSAPPVVQEQASFVAANGQGLFGPATNSPLFVPPVVQPKLSVSQPGDTFEQEADATADHIMRMSIPSASADSPDGNSDDTPAASPMPAIMPKCAACEEEENEKQPDVQAKVYPTGLVSALPVMRKPADEEDDLMPNIIQAKFQSDSTHLMLKCSYCEAEARETVPRKPGKGESNGSGFSLESYLQRSQSSGEPMDRSTRSFMESRFDANFSSVRIHTDSQAGQASDSIQARAFTHGQHIHVNAGEYQPQTSGGQWLLAHELTHTIQQSNGQVRPSVMRKAKPDEPAFYEFVMGGKKAYAEAKDANLASWYDGYKFFNLFQEEGIYPGSHPNAYATRVYELQEKLHELLKDKYPETNITGVLEPSFLTSPTLNALLGVASGYANAANVPVDSAGFNPDMLKRLNRLNTSFEKQSPPLESRLFLGIPQLNMVNASKNFEIVKGDRGYYVSVIQSALLELNYALGSDYALTKGKTEKLVTGIFGEDTRKAVEQFQIDSGMEGKDVNGVVGQMTIRLLDRRLTKYVKTRHSYAEANIIGFTVPVTEKDIPSDPSQADTIKHDMLIRTIMAAMPLSASEAENLLTSGWHWMQYRDVTVDDVAKGFIVNSITKADYEKIMGQAKKGGTVSAEQISSQIVDQALELQTTDTLYQLNKEIKALEKRRDNLNTIIAQSEHYLPPSIQEDLNQVEKELKIKNDLRTRELQKLGFRDLDEYTGKQDQFVKTFLQYAAMIAFKMLAQNEAKASVEYQHYENAEEIKKLKTSIDQLNNYYAESDTYLMQGVSWEETDGKDINKYKTRDDYVLANESCDDMGCNGAAYEAILDSRWQASVKEKSAKNPYYAKLFDVESTAFKYLKDKSESFPILGNPKFDIRHNGKTYATKTNEALRDDVREIIGTRTSDDGVLHNIANTRERIRGDVELIWEMPPVIAVAKAELGIIEGTVLDNIIVDAYKAHQDKGFWTTIFKAALGIGLGLLALVSGPVGWVALGASIAYGAYDAYNTFKEIQWKREASETAIDEETMALMHEKPSYLWFVVSMAGVGLDALQAFKVIKAVKAGVELADGVQAAINTEIATSKLEQAGLKAGSKEAVALGRRVERLEKALKEIDWVHYAEHSKILTVLKDSPFAVRFMADALKEPGLAKAFTKLAKLGLSEDLMKTVVSLYAGVGKKAIGELPEVMRLIESGKLAANAELVKTVLTDLKVQKALLDSGDAGKIAKLFAEWEASSAGKTLSFAEHLKQSGLNTFFQKGVVLTERFGAEFAQMNNLLKNKLILREIEPLLVDALNAKRLPPSVQRTLEVSLQRDILGLTNDLGIAQERMAKEISALGGTLQFQSEYLALTSLLQNQQSRKLLWEAASQLPGRADYLKLVDELAATNPKVKKVMDDLIKIGPITDKSTLERLVAEDAFRKALADNPLAVMALKKCASPCFPPNATSEQISRLTKLLAGKSNDEIAKVNNLIYNNRATAQTLEAAITKLETDFDEVIKTAKGPEVIFPASLKVTDSIKSMAGTVVSLGMPSAQVNSIIKNIVANGGATTSRVENVMTDLIKVLELDNKVKMKNLSALLNSLESSDKNLFKTAEFLVDEVARHTNVGEAEKAFFTFPGLQKTDSLISQFGMDGLRDILQANRNQTGFINNLYFLTQKVSGTKTELAELARQAGSGGKADLEKLAVILESQPGKLTYQQAVDSIARSKSFASDVAKAMADPVNGYQKMAKRVWGEASQVAENGAIDVPAQLKKGVDGAGSEAYKLVIKEGRGIDLANTVLSGKTVDYSKWKVLKSVIENSTVPQSIKNLIIGELWTTVHVRWLEENSYKLFREVKLTDGVTVAKADIVAVKEGEMLVVEMKSMAAELSKNQASIYPLLQDPGKIKTLKFFENAEVDALFAANHNQVSYKLFEEATLVPK